MEVRNEKLEYYGFTAEVQVKMGQLLASRVNCQLAAHCVAGSVGVGPHKKLARVWMLT